MHLRGHKVNMYFVPCGGIFVDYISSTGNTYKAKIAQRIFCERVNDTYNKVICIYYSKGKDLKRE